MAEMVSAGLAAVEVDLSYVAEVPFVSLEELQLLTRWWVSWGDVEQ